MSEQQRDRKEGKTENEAMRKKKKKSFRVNSFSPQKNYEKRNKTKHLVSTRSEEAKDIQNGSLTLETHALFSWKRNS